MVIKVITEGQTIRVDKVENQGLAKGPTTTYLTTSTVHPNAQKWLVIVIRNCGLLTGTQDVKMKAKQRNSS